MEGDGGNLSCEGLLASSPFPCLEPAMRAARLASEMALGSVSSRTKNSPLLPPSLSRSSLSTGRRKSMLLLLLRMEEETRTSATKRVSLDGRVSADRLACAGSGVLGARRGATLLAGGREEARR